MTKLKAWLMNINKLICMDVLERLPSNVSMKLINIHVFSLCHMVTSQPILHLKTHSSAYDILNILFSKWV